MKKIFLSLCLSASSLYLSAQNIFPATGNAGIGTTNLPQRPGYNTLTINNSNVGGYGGMIELQTGGMAKGLLFGDGGGVSLWSGTGLPLRFWTDGNEKMVILPDGRVGMGYFMPRARLEVSPTPGSGSSALMRGTGSQAWGNVLTLTTDLANGDDPRLLFSYRNGVKNWAVGGQVATTRFGIWEDAGDGLFGSGFGTERFSILPGGNVGIGTSSPDAKLSVNGVIHAKEVKIDLNGWPDYVFKSDYLLPTVSDMEKYINVNGHLAGMPSAEQVAKDGINLGEMNVKLLEKIEEMSLYIIKLNNDIQELKAKSTAESQNQSQLQNQKFKKEIGRLKSKMK